MDGAKFCRCARMEKRITPDELADMLMRRVYVPFSAVSAVNGRGEILSLCQDGEEDNAG